jgi:hypothetical protein
VAKTTPPSTTVHTRYTNAQLEAANGRAAELGLSRGEYLRELVSRDTAGYLARSEPTIDAVRHAAFGDFECINLLAERALRAAPGRIEDCAEALGMACVWSMMATYHPQASAETFQRLGVIQLMRASLAANEGNMSMAADVSAEGIANLNRAADLGSEDASRAINNYALNVPAHVMLEACRRADYPVGLAICQGDA